MGEPEDIGSVIALLVSDEMGWVNGQSIEVSEGMNLYRRDSYKDNGLTHVIRGFFL